MASKRAGTPARHLFNGFKRHPHTRTMATETPHPNATLSQTYIDAHLTSAPTEPILQDSPSLPIPPPGTVSARSRSQPGPPPPPSPLHQKPHNPFLTTHTCTLHSFPTLEPTAFTHYPSTHLHLPLRKDLLHRAVIYEGDATRAGTANTRYRTEVHGSNRKIRPQKGTGRARLGDKKSPMLRGGGVAFGPKPRDFATGLPKAIYDLAWRTALSYRYRMGQLLVLEGEAELAHIAPASARVRFLREMLQHNRMGHADGRTLFVTLREREALFEALEEEKMGREARAEEVGDVDVKDLLEGGRVVVERGALERMLREHEGDLGAGLRLGAWRKGMEGIGV